MRRPLILWLLVVALIFLGVGGLYGGVMMLADPAGNLIQMAPVLPMLPVADYTLPGLFLLFVMGLLPLVLAYALIVRPDWGWFDRLAAWSKHHWAWTGTVILSIGLGVWLAVQVSYIGFRWPIQTVTAVNGVVILLLALIPGIRKFYAR